MYVRNSLPEGTQLTLDDIEKIYSDQYPEWHQTFQCFPQGPLFFDKLFNTKPYIKAKDIEMKRRDLRRKMKCIVPTVLPIKKHD